MMYNNYECKVASPKEVLEHDNKYLSEGVKSKEVIVYYGYLDNEIITEGRAYLLVDGRESLDYDLLDKNMASLSGFKTKLEYQNRGYFSKLFKFVLEDLKKRGITEVTLGVEKDNERNMNMYKKWGFDNFIKESLWQDKNGKSKDIMWISKKL